MGIKARTDDDAADVWYSVHLSLILWHLPRPSNPIGLIFAIGTSPIVQHPCWPPKPGKKPSSGQPNL